MPSVSQPKACTGPTIARIITTTTVPYKNSVPLFNAFSEIEPVTSELDAMRQWLLSQKQTNDWGAVPSTLEAIYALLEGGTDWLAPDESKTSIVWGGQEMKNNPEEPFWD